MQPNYNYNYSKPPNQNSPHQAAQSPQLLQPSQQPPQIQQNSNQSQNALYQQQLMMNQQMRYNPQMMYQMMRGQMQVPGMMPNFNPQIAQMQQFPSQPQLTPQQQQQLAAQHQSQQRMYQQYAARNNMPFQIQQYQQPYKKSSPNAPFSRQPNSNNIVNVKPNDTKKTPPMVPNIPPPKPNNPPAHIPTARQVGIKLLQPIDANDPTIIRKKSKKQGHSLLKDELVCLFRSIDRKHAYYKFADEFDAMITLRSNLLQTYYNTQKLQVTNQMQRHINIQKDIQVHQIQYNISPQKIVKDIKDVGYSATVNTLLDKDYYNKKRNSRVLPCRWIGLHERQNFGRRVRMPLVSIYNKPNTTNSDVVLAPIRLNINMDGIAISDVFTWDINTSTGMEVTPALFAHVLVEDFKYPMHKDILDKIIQQINTGIEDYITTPRRGINSADRAHENADDKAVNDLRIRIKINITIGFVSLEDEFEWDVYNQDNSPEEFAEILAIDLHLGGEFM
eukprot:NODE_330_length_10876_cov_0.359840.p2 type:complete len:503 gc:universal NODE_330_length_10876_cov_0.359840:10068-8560(-)